MLTRTGVLVLVASATVVAAGRVFGLKELFIIGSTGLAALALAACYVGFRRLSVQVRRELSPPRVYAGSPGRVELRLTNRAPLRSPVLRLEDEVTGTHGVDLQVAPLATRAETVAVYRLPTERRGAVTVGPLRLTVHDPFGLTRLTTTADRQMTLIVYPKIYPVPAPPRSSGSTPEHGASQRDRVAPSGEEFAGLRPYVVGDELRRVHWPISARHDELVIRQEEAPWLGRMTIALDTRAEVVPEADFEEMVSATASLLVSANRRGDQLRLVTSAGYDSGAGNGANHLLAMLEHLALVQPTSHALSALLDRLSRSSHGGTVVAVLAPTTTAESHFLDHVASQYHRRVSVSFGAVPTPPAAARSVGSGTIVPVPLSSPFPDAWHLAFGTRARLTS